MFQIINGGIYTRHPADFQLTRNHGFDHYVLLFIRSEALLTLNGSTRTIQPDHALFIAPHTPYSYHNPHGEYIDNWLHFECEKSDLNTRLFHIPFAVNNPPLITSYFEQILYENSYSPESLRKEHIHTLFHLLTDHLFYDLNHAPDTAYSPYLYPMQKLRMELQAAPQNARTAKEASSQLGISLSYFQHLYSRFFHISYQKDIIQMRIEYAKELLHSTAMTIEEISRSCGYTNTVHFYRQFLACTGRTPGDYRE